MTCLMKPRPGAEPRVWGRDPPCHGAGPPARAGLVRTHSGDCAAGECAVSFAHTPIGCWIATRGSEIVGYACYDATAPDFFGPTRVLDSEQGHGVGTALLLRCLTAMREYGYGYAIIGSVGPVEFYQKTCNATVIPDSDPGIYKDFFARNGKKSGKALIISNE